MTPAAAEAPSATPRSGGRSTAACEEALSGSAGPRPEASITAVPAEAACEPAQPSSAGRSSGRRKDSSRRVSFAEALEVEIPIFTPSLEAQGRQARPGARGEDQARANLARLVANHRRVSKRWSPFEDLRSWFSSTLSRHVVLRGDVLLIGREPGRVDRAVGLRGAQVAVCGSTVVVRPNALGSSSVALQLDSTSEAEKWAAELQAAAALWERTLGAAEAALLKHSERRPAPPQRPLAHEACPRRPPPAAPSADLGAAAWRRATVWVEGDLFGQVVVENMPTCFGWLATSSTPRLELGR